MAPSEDAVKYEKVGRGTGFGYQNAGTGTARPSVRCKPEDGGLLVPGVQKENPCMMDALESDVNNALDVIRKAERGEN